MKNSLVKKLTIIIEATKSKSITSDVINSIKKLEKSISSRSGMKLTLTDHEDQNNLSSPNAYDVNRTTNISPANWDYWAV